MPSREDTLTDPQDVQFEGLQQLNFDPVQYLNDVLPTLSLTSQISPTKQNRTSALQNASTDTQAFLSKMNTHNVRSSSELTTLTDEVLRSGSRLAYEVEVLRGDVNSLYELLTDALKDDIAQFVAQEIDANAGLDNQRSPPIAGSAHQDPEFMRKLRTLGLVKVRLEAVIGVFGEALKWPIPPSEVSMASLISVSAPELGVANSAEDDKAREYTRQLRNEITVLMDSNGGGYAGLDTAAERVNDFRQLTLVWKGTAEEKARTRVVDGLARMIEDRRKALDARAAPVKPSTEGSSQRPNTLPGRAGRIVEGSSSTAAGLFRNLQKLRDEIYLD